MEVSGPNMVSGSFRKVDKSDSAQKLINLGFGSDTRGRWGLIVTAMVNGCELNFGVFQSVWISKILSGCFSFNFLEGVCFCGCF